MCFLCALVNHKMALNMFPLMLTIKYCASCKDSFTSELEYSRKFGGGPLLSAPVNCKQSEQSLLSASHTIITEDATWPRVFFE